MRSRRNLAGQREREKRIVGVGGHGGLCPGVESGVSTQSLRDSKRLYHARQRIPAMQRIRWASSPAAHLARLRWCCAANNLAVGSLATASVFSHFLKP